MKKVILAAMLLAATALGLTACGQTATPPAEETSSVVASAGNTEAPDESLRSGKYVSAFQNSTETTAEAVVDELMALELMETQMVKMEVEPGYLAGFSKDIDGFSKGYQFAPMIGTIPFVAYVFESDDPAALQAKLDESADKQWNICTEADEAASAIRGNLVFFLMCPAQ